METQTYPQYYQRAARVIKVVSPTEMRTILLPPESLVPERFTSRYPSAARLQEELDLLHANPSDEHKYQEYLFTFYQKVDAEREALNRYRQKMIDEGKIKL